MVGCCCAASGCAASCAASCAAASCASMAASSACMTAAICASNASRMSFYANRDDDENYSQVSISFKNPEVHEKRRKDFLGKIFNWSDKWEDETLSQAAFLKDMSNALRKCGYEDITFIDIDRKNVFRAKENTHNDIDAAMKKAFETAPKPEGHYTVSIGIDSDGDGKADAVINMHSEHKKDEYPMTIETISGKHPKETLKELKRAIGEVFDVDEVNEDE